MPRARLAGLATFLIASVPAVSCTPDRRPERTADGAACVVHAEGDVLTCSDSVDNDCDGHADCADPNCSGIGACPVCGTVEHSLPDPLPLPDGVSDGASCASSSTCEAATPSCVDMSCHAAYASTLTFAGFAANHTFSNVTNIQSVCVTIEHSWLPDLEIVLRAPDGRQVELARMPGRAVIEEVYLGEANDCDTPDSPSPGIGATYCWSPTATAPSMIAYVHGGGTMDPVVGCMGDIRAELPPGVYGIDGAWSDLVGAPLNGAWSLVVTDAWKLDNGYLFRWSIAFDPSLVEDCSGPVIQ